MKLPSDFVLKRIGLLLLLLWIVYGCFVNFAAAAFIIASCLLVFYIPVLVFHADDLLLLIPGAENSVGVSNDISAAPVGSGATCDKQVRVPQKVNEALETFLNKVVEKYVESWHSHLDPPDDAFVNEIRYALHVSLSRLLHKFKLVNWSELLTKKILPSFLLHVDCFLQFQHLKSSREQKVLFALGKDVHRAVHSRRAEENYLRTVTEFIVKKLLPQQYQTSRLLTVITRDLLSCVVLQNAMDAVADPDSVNKLILAWLEEDKKIDSLNEESNEESVPLLHSFAKTKAEKLDLALYPKLKEILKTPSQLYYFMQFLRKESALHFLQFCFAVDEFNEKLLNPDLPEAHKTELHTAAKKLFESFFASTSSDAIDFEENIRQDMEQIVYSTDDIENLRKKDTLFRAYDHALDVLEMRYLPRYYRSYEFFQFISGAQNSSASGKDPKGSKGKNPVNGSGWKAKLRTAMRTSAPGWPSFEGSILNAIAPKEDFDTAVDLTEVDFIQDDSDDSEPETAGSYGDLIPICGRDLSAWRVSIPRVTTTSDTSGKRIHCFEIDIQRIDLRPEDDPEEYHWTVLRSYQEFYTLEAKLGEFHGDLFELRLPPKKIFGTRNPEFLENVRPSFESFLRSLLQQPALKSSDLIFAFLTLTDLSAAAVLTDGLFVGGGNFLPDLGFSRIIRHVPMKLRQERGQHLDNFLNSFVASTEAPRPKASKSDARENIEVSVPLFKKYHPLFQDNAATFCYDPAKYSQGFNKPARLEGIYESLLFIGLRILPLSERLWNVLAGLRSIFSPMVNRHARCLIKSKLRQCVKTSRLVHIISLLQGIVTEERASTPRKAELLERREKALTLLESNIPPWFSYITENEDLSESVRKVFQCFQAPILNKQLSYVLLDLLLSELFPEEFTVISE